MTIETPNPAEPDTLSVVNISKPKRMFWIGFYTLLLNLITLTIFRFWGTTHFRKQLWSDTLIDGEPLEYTGTGKELFIGFLIATLILAVPFVAVLVSAQLFLSPALLPLVILPLYFFMFIIIGVAIFLQRRYHLSRTRYRGIRFAMTGSAWKYGFSYLAWLLLSAITLGWVAPLMRIRLSEKLWNNSSFGDEKITFADNSEAMSEPVWLSFAVAWFGGIVSYMAWGASFFFLVQASGIDMTTGAASPMFIVILYASMIPLILLVTIFYSWHHVTVTRRIAKSLSMGELKATSNLSMWSFLWVNISNLLLIIFTLGIGLYVAQMRLWRRYADSLSFEGKVDFASIEQTTIAQPKTGEGLADGLDIGAGF